MRRRYITNEEILLSWLQTDRGGKVTSWATICRYHCLMRNLKGVVQNLVDAGSIRKLRAGYKANGIPRGAKEHSRQESQSKTKTKTAG